VISAAVGAAEAVARAGTDFGAGGLLAAAAVLAVLLAAAPVTAILRARRAVSCSSGSRAG
jgi:hypothetical protein